MNTLGRCFLMGLSVATVAHATHVPNDTLLVNSWIKIREMNADGTPTQNDWMIAYDSATTLKVRSESNFEAQLSLYLDGTALTTPAGSLAALRDTTLLHTYVGLKNQVGAWTIRSTTNITTSPQIFNTEFLWNGNVAGGFYSGNFGLGATTPTAKLHVVGTTRLDGPVTATSLTTGSVILTAPAGDISMGDYGL